MSKQDIEGLTSETYKVPKGEEGVYHCLIEVVEFNKKTGKKETRPRIQKFGKKIFESVVYDSLLKQGYTITILYNPTEYLKERMAKANQSAADKAKAEKERFDAAVDKAVQAKLDVAVADAVAKAMQAQNAGNADQGDGDGSESGKRGRKANN